MTHLEEHGTIDPTPDVEAMRAVEGNNEPYTPEEAEERVKELRLERFNKRLRFLMP